MIDHTRNGKGGRRRKRGQRDRKADVLHFKFNLGNLGKQTTQTIFSRLRNQSTQSRTSPFSAFFRSRPSPFSAPVPFFRSVYRQDPGPSKEPVKAVDGK